MTKEIDFDAVGSLIAKLRETYSLNQQQFAKDIGVSKGAVCQWEQGAHIKTENLYDIAKYFNITISELINGQLNDEGEEDYFLRNFNLNEFNYFNSVDDTNYDELLEYLKRCRNVIKRFMYLYKLMKNEKCTIKQEHEFYKLERYFKPDYQYAASLKMDIPNYSFGEIETGLKENFLFEDDNEFDYMLYRCLSLDIKVDPLAILGYEGGDLAVHQYLELIGMEYCDELLTKLISDLSDDEIEHSLAIKRLIEFGARCFYTRKHLECFSYNILSEGIFEQLKGVYRNSLFEEKYEFFKEEANKRENDQYYFDPYSWKNFNRKNYDYLIDSETTSRIRDIVLLKDRDPQTYYKNLVQRDLEHLRGN